MTCSSKSVTGGVLLDSFRQHGGSLCVCMRQYMCVCVCMCAHYFQEKSVYPCTWCQFNIAVYAYRNKWEVWMHNNDGVVEEVRAQDCFHLTCSFRRSSPSGVQPPLVLSSLRLEEDGVNEGETLVKTSGLLIRDLMARSVYWAGADLNPALFAQPLHCGCAWR